MLYVTEKGKPTLAFPTGVDKKIEDGKMIIVDEKGEPVTKAVDASGKDLEVQPFDFVPGAKGMHSYPIVVSG